MDAQMVVNSPPLVDGTMVRGPHLDVPNTLISALLYLRREDDDSVGGSWSSTPAGGEVLFNEVNGVVRDKVRNVRSYPYRHNLMILPMVTPLGLHAVSPRARTKWPRYHLHIVGEMSEMLFQHSVCRKGAKRLTLLAHETTLLPLPVPLLLGLALVM